MGLGSYRISRSSSYRVSGNAVNDNSLLLYNNYLSGISGGSLSSLFRRTAREERSAEENSGN